MKTSRGSKPKCAGVKRPRTSSNIRTSLPANKKVVVGDLMSVAVPAKQEQCKGTADRTTSSNVLTSEPPNKKIVIGDSRCVAVSAANKEQDSTSQPDKPDTPAKACGDNAEQYQQRKKVFVRKAFECPKRSFFAKYDQAEAIGTGSFGQVYKGLRRRDQLPVAIKYMPIRGAKNVKISVDKYQPAEVFYHRHLHHPNIIKLLAHHVFDGQHVLVLERPSKCIDLFDYLATRENILSEKESKEIFRQLLSAVQYLDEKSILHHDLKSENILLDLSDGKKKVKVIDFGLADAVKQEPITRFFGTREFCPPEYHTHHQYDGRKATVWSLGCILHDC